MANFNQWTHENLVKFANETASELKRQQDTVEALRADLRTALDSYRALNTQKETPWTNTSSKQKPS